MSMALILGNGIGLSNMCFLCTGCLFHMYIHTCTRIQTCVHMYMFMCKNMLCMSTNMFVHVCACLCMSVNSVNKTKPATEAISFPSEYTRTNMLTHDIYQKTHYICM